MANADTKTKLATTLILRSVRNGEKGSALIRRSATTSMAIDQYKEPENYTHTLANQQTSEADNQQKKKRSSSIKSIGSQKSANSDGKSSKKVSKKSQKTTKKDSGHAKKRSVPR